MSGLKTPSLCHYMSAVSARDTTSWARAAMYKGKDLLDMEPEERARAGLFMRHAPQLFGSLPEEPSWFSSVLARWGCVMVKYRTPHGQAFLGRWVCAWLREPSKLGPARPGGQCAAGAHAGGKLNPDLPMGLTVDFTA